MDRVKYFIHGWQLPALLSCLQYIVRAATKGQSVVTSVCIASAHQIHVNRTFIEFTNYPY